MLELELWVWNNRPIITLLIVVCVLAQTLAAILCCYKRTGRGRILIEFALLAIALACSLLPGKLLFGDTVSGNILPYIFIPVIPIILIRGVCICAIRARELRLNLSALSVKAAIDALHTGVLFGEKNGLILLSNERMQALMRQLTGKVHRNGNALRELLLSGEVLPGCEKRELERQIVYLLPDRSAWMFTWAELKIKNKAYFQLTAADIQERWELTEQLREHEERLKQRRDEISASIANLHELSRERETQNAKMRAHDILGERLILLLRAIRNEQAPDYDLLRALSGGLIDELKADAATPRDELDSLVNIFGSLGVEIEIIGDLPSDDDKARLFVEIAREAVTNAVKHGFATEVTIRTSGGHMEISDNGFSASGEIKEGGGLNGMRRRLERFGGALFVQILPRFTLTVELP